jgi:hypothetical protein
VGKERNTQDKEKDRLEDVESVGDPHAESTSDNDGYRDQCTVDHGDNLGNPQMCGLPSTLVTR